MNTSLHYTVHKFGAVNRSVDIEIRTKYTDGKKQPETGKTQKGFTGRVHFERVGLLEIDTNLEAVMLQSEFYMPDLWWT